MVVLLLCLALVKKGSISSWTVRDAVSYSVRGVLPLSHTIRLSASAHACRSLVVCGETQTRISRRMLSAIRTLLLVRSACSAQLKSSVTQIPYNIADLYLGHYCGPMFRRRLPRIAAEM
jgi:hypothetical protein